jgi:hypothetical protein
MLRLVLLLILIVFIARAFWRVVDGLIEGISGRTPNVPTSGGQMVRDPVCGTFVLPERAVTLGAGRQRVCFCSTVCRDAYRARTA